MLVLVLVLSRHLLDNNVRMRNQVDLGHQYNTIADLMYILFVLQDNKRIHGDSMHDTCAVNVLKFGWCSLY